MYLYKLEFSETKHDTIMQIFPRKILDEIFAIP